MFKRPPLKRSLLIDTSDRRRTVVVAGLSIAVVGALMAVDMATAPKAHAQVPAAAPNLQTFTFAPIVERVRPAVVSIRVKSEVAGPRESFAETFPDLPEGGPLDRFFFQIGRAHV